MEVINELIKQLQTYRTTPVAPDTVYGYMLLNLGIINVTAMKGIPDTHVVIDLNDKTFYVSLGYCHDLYNNFDKAIHIAKEIKLLQNKTSYSIKFEFTQDYVEQIFEK